MQQLMNFLGSNVQLLVFLAVIFFSIMGTVAKKLQEKQAERRVSMETRRREFERLRTGRVKEEEADEPGPRNAEAERQRRLEELAERRRRQLEELRRRRAAAGSGTPTTSTRAPTTAPPRPAPRPAQRPAPTPRPAPSRQPTARPAPTQRSHTMPTASTPMPAERRRPQARPSRTPTPSRPAPDGASLRGATAPIGTNEIDGTPLPPPPAASERLGPFRGMSRMELRRAIVLSEILAPPISQREMSA